MARPARPVDPGSEHDLLVAAAHAFARDGYRAASLNEILQTAGWAKSSLYHYFGNKKGLHDHVVLCLRDRLGDGLDLPELETLTAEGFWPAMGGLVDRLGSTAAAHPETRQLGLMYHRDKSVEPDCALQGLRDDVADWLGRAIHRGLALGVVRDDIPADLAVGLATSVLGVLDRWNLDRDLHSPDATDAGRLSLTLIQDLLATRRPSG